MFQVEPLYQDRGGWSKDLPAMLRNRPFQSLQVIEESFSQAAFDRAAKWLSHCLENDQACDLHKAGKSEFMPQHLIDIGSWSGSHEPFLFKPSQPAPYVCLSYCWGSDTNGILTTTTNNIGSHYVSIPVSNMPRGIQDAVAVCRGMKISNLWVDSLCIPQDDPVAWLHDAKEMDQIYLHSLLTIAALEPASCKSPFLGRQRYGHPEWQRRLVTDVSPKEDEAPLEVFLRGTTNMEDSDPDERYSLDKRGWCLQESLLPNRRLSFNGDEMIWECLCRKVCECGHILWKPQASHLATSGVALKQPLLKAKVIRSRPLPAIQELGAESLKYRPWEPNDVSEDYPSDPHRRWRQLVMDFSRRSVSREEDKLNAVSGLANMICKNIQHELQDHSSSGPISDPHGYIAGLWKQELHFDLAWKVVHPSPGSPVEGVVETTNTEKKHLRTAGRDRVFPSWSWASVDQPVTYDFDKTLSAWKYSPFLTNCIKVESISYKRDLRDGEIATVCDGRAVLTGHMVDVVLETVVLESIVLETVKSDTEFRHRHQLQVRVRRPYNGCVCETFLDRHGSVRRGDELRCFRLFSWEAFTGRVDYDGNIFKAVKMGPESWFLVLRRLAVAEELFERVGLGSDDGYGVNMDLFADCSTDTVNIV